MSPAPWTHRLADMMAFKGVLASVSLSHPASCSCETCKAASGDDDAFARLYSQQQSSSSSKGEG